MPPGPLGPASRFHAPAMAELHQTAFPPAEAWDAAAFAALLQLPGAFGCICADGFVLGRVAADEAELLTLAVLPQARRRGLGRALLRAAMAHAAAQGAQALFVDVAAANHAARGLYAAAGAAPIGRRRAYYPGGGDALTLRIGLVRPCGSAQS